MDFENSQTKKNLEAAFAGESQAHTKYRYYSSKAKKEGFVQISNIFMETALNESEHAKLWFKELHGGEIPGTLENLRDAAAGENYEWTTMYDEFAKTGEVFAREGVKVWKCLNCGHLHVGPEAPEICPVCAHPKAYFEEQVVNY